MIPIGDSRLAPSGISLLPAPPDNSLSSLSMAIVGELGRLSLSEEDTAVRTPLSSKIGVLRLKK